MHHDPKDPAKPNLIPYVDILTTLMGFLMLTMATVQTAAIPTSVPGKDSAAGEARAPLEIALCGEHAALDEQLVSRSELGPALKAWHAARPDATEVHLLSSDGDSVAETASVLDLARGVGLTASVLDIQSERSPSCERRSLR